MQVCARLSALTDELWQAGDPVLKCPTAHTVSVSVFCVPSLYSGIHQCVVNLGEKAQRCMLQPRHRSISGIWLWSGDSFVPVYAT